MNPFLEIMDPSLAKHWPAQQVILYSDHLSKLEHFRPENQSGFIGKENYIVAHLVNSNEMTNSMTSNSTTQCDFMKAQGEH